MARDRIKQKRLNINLPLLKRFALPEILLNEIYTEKEEKNKGNFLPLPLSQTGLRLPLSIVWRVEHGDLSGKGGEVVMNYHK